MSNLTLQVYQLASSLSSCYCLTRISLLRAQTSNLTLQVTKLLDLVVVQDSSMRFYKRGEKMQYIPVILSLRMVNLDNILLTPPHPSERGELRVLVGALLT